jgi:hypothetical protein
MKKAGRRRSTISTASWRRELSDPQAVLRALVAPATLLRWHGDLVRRKWSSRVLARTRATAATGSRVSACRVPSASERR